MKMTVVVVFSIVATGLPVAAHIFDRRQPAVEYSSKYERGEVATTGITAAAVAAASRRGRQPSTVRIAQAVGSPIAQKKIMVVLVTERTGGQPGFAQASVETEEAPLNERTHAFSATCASPIADGKKAYVLLTNPQNIGDIANGDKLLVTAPVCPEMTGGGVQSRTKFAIKMAGGAPTQLPRPQPQYVLIGDVLSQEPAQSTLSARRDCEFCPRMVDVPGGTFLMGSDHDASEKPIHEMTVAPFLLSQFPITMGEWNQCVAAKSCPEEPVRQAGSDATSVHNVSWDDAQQYVAWITQTTQQTYRLPSEVEWEYAARARSTTAYWWGDRLADGVANCQDCGQPYAVDRPMEVENLMPNPLAVFGVAGGVEQWVADCWHPSYKEAPTDGSAWQHQECRDRVLRGGSWKDDPSRIRTASRNHFDASAREMTHGFRIARSPAFGVVEAATTPATMDRDNTDEAQGADPSHRGRRANASLEEPANNGAKRQSSWVTQAGTLEIQLVNALNKAFGKHPGIRPNHAKGIVVSGSSKAFAQAAGLSKAVLFSGSTIRVTVRFSDATGIPNLPDGSKTANPHGMAIKFHLPDGSETDMVINSLKFSPVSTGEEFRDLLLALAASPPDAAKPTTFDRFVAKHPRVLAAFASAATPDSFAHEEYCGVDAFVFINKKGDRQAVRYQMVPEHVVHLDEADAAKRAPNFLIDELPERLKRGPVTFHFKAQLAAAGDATKDATQPWPEDRKVVELGLLTIDKARANSAEAEKSLVFLPGQLTEGIEPSDDPLIGVRNGVYGLSFSRRNP
jgi:catalase